MYTGTGSETVLAAYFKASLLGSGAAPIEK
jgi:hypothetical protein